jgi:hypothetical protein
VVQESYSADNGDGFVFNMKLPLVFYGNGVDTTIDMSINELQSVHDFQLPFDVDSVKIDPELWWLIGRKNVEQRDYLLSENDLVAFPNPVHNQLNIAATNPNERITKIEVFKVDGRVLLQTEITGSVPLEVFSTDVSNFDSGLYLVRVQLSQSSRVTKVIKQ